MTYQGTMQLPKMDDTEISPGITLMGEPFPIPGSNLMRCLANVYGSLAVVELNVKFPATRKNEL